MSVLVRRVATRWLGLLGASFLLGGGGGGDAFRVAASRALRHNRLCAARAPLKDEVEEDSWRDSLTKVDIDDKMLYSMFKRQLNILIPGFDPKKQLAVSAWRGVARLRDVTLNATMLNYIFNPFLDDDDDDVTEVMSLVGLSCDGVSVSWPSVFSLLTEPLDVKISRAVLHVDSKAPIPQKSMVKAARAEWVNLVGEPKDALSNYPIVEGARFVIDELVVNFRGVDTPFPRYAENAHMRVTARAVEARSVDNEGRPNDLRSCWRLLNPQLRNATKPAKRAYIAKRVVARQVECELAESHKPAPLKQQTGISVLEASAWAPAETPEQQPRGDPRLPLKLDGPVNGTVKEPLLLSAASLADNIEKKEEPLVFDRIVDAPRAEMLVTIGYDVASHQVVAVRYDVDGHELGLSLASEAWSKPRSRRKPGVHDAGTTEFFATLGTTKVSRAEDEVLELALTRRSSPVKLFFTRVVRPAFALAFFFWAAKI